MKILNHHIFHTRYGTYRVLMYISSPKQPVRIEVRCQRHAFLFFWQTTRIETYYEVAAGRRAWLAQNDRFARLEHEFKTTTLPTRD